MISRSTAGSRRWFIPEVIQTSAMDCGPAALKALLDGFGLHVSYGRLREACHTDVDGTSIDTLEELTRELNLNAEQVLLPADHVLLEESQSLPALAVTRTPSGAAHFVCLWRAHGPFVQIMDPARGRMWIRRQVLLDQLFSHSAHVPEALWREFAGSPDFLVPLRRRLAHLGTSQKQADRYVASAKADASWRSLALLDSSVRMVTTLGRSGALDGRTARGALDALVADPSGQSDVIPDHYWSARAADTASPQDGTQLRVRGAVLVRVRHEARPSAKVAVSRKDDPVLPASPELRAAMTESPARPLRHVWKAIRAGGLLGPGLAAAAIAIAAAGVVLEALLLRSLIDVSTLLSRPEQGLAAGLFLSIFAAALLGVELVLASAERRAGSHLETRLRIRFLDKIPRLADSYFQSRPISDMLERSHSVHVLRILPQLAVRVLRVTAELAVTTLAIAWLDPRMAWIALVAAAAAAGIPLLGNIVISERDLKARTHTGALTRFHLDALLGRTAIEAHGAARTVEREHDRLLAEWVRASLSLQRSSTIVEGLQLLVGFGFAAWILFGHFGTSGSATLLLLAYWVLNLPALGYELALAAREYPAHRSTILRLLEPLGAPDADSVEAHGTSAEADRPDGVLALETGVRIEARHLSVQVSGHSILEHIDLQIPAGAHVAIVGASGAGKSTLIGALLGWHRASGGELLVDGRPLTAARLAALRRETAWVDPAVQLWNRSLLENLTYGSSGQESMTGVLEGAGLIPVIAKLPDGLATSIGEAGSLLSAGEGQRVRLGRAMTRQGTRLVLLDEPFLGLERDRRRSLLTQARQRWAGRTMLYVTHDIAETRAFDHVVVLDRGRIVEEGEPLQLSQMASSRYRRLLQAQDAANARLTSGADWRRVRLEAGRIVQDHAGTALEQRA
jgi:ATP-binding cassette subfamily B protein